MSMQVAQASLSWTFGDRLRKVRRSLGLDQHAFADLTGLPKSSVTNWEADISKPRDLVRAARQIEAATGVSAGWILGLIQDPSGPGAAAATGPATITELRPNRDATPLPTG